MEKDPHLLNDGLDESGSGATTRAPDNQHAITAALARDHRPRDPTATSFLMSRVRSKDTRMEVALRKALHSAGYRYRKNDRKLPGQPDIVFVSHRVAIFVDGDFWHGRVLIEGGREALKASLKTANRDFWIAKIEANVARDVRIVSALESAGWLVLRFWERELRRDLPAAVASIVQALEAMRR
jgi:DNA mismatch endonuclease (patch repair protein)